MCLVRILMHQTLHEGREQASVLLSVEMAAFVPSKIALTDDPFLRQL